MAFKNPQELYHNFVKLAEESGFTFNTHKPRHNVDWNRIRLLDVDNLIRDRKFVLIEQHVNDILDCALESEFDVRILDEGVVKMFRLAQLTIEYQQFCKHYLDRSVYVLRDELTSVMQQLEAARKDLREKDEEVKKHKRKSKHNFRPPLMYGNDNIASLILKTLSNNGEMLPTTSLLELSHQYNKCNYCDKVFLNQLYLKSHMTRRHAHVTEIPQKDSQKDLDNNAQNDKVKLNDEIMELKCKLKEVETSITNMNTLKAVTVDAGIQSNITETENNMVTRTKEPEFSTKIENNLLEHKLEVWKREEHDKYTKDIDALRSQIMDTINSLKETPQNNQNESILIQQLQQTIKEQGQQIVVLTRDITENNAKAEKEKAEKSKDIEAQLRQWVQKVDVQTQQQELLVLRLNDVAKEAQEARAAVEAERHRAARLETLLQRAREHEKTPSSPEQIRDPDKSTRDSKQQSIRCGETIDNLQTETKSNGSDIAKNYRKSKLTSHRKTLDELHQKAQELLNVKSSSTSEESSSEQLNYFPRTVQNTRKEINDVKTLRITKDAVDEVNSRGKNKGKKHNNQTRVKVKGETSQFDEKSKQISSEKVYLVNGLAVLRSPVRVIRAKLTEEVNNRLVTAGVDPLKSGLHPTDYNKQRMQLQQQQRLKTKKNPEFDKVRNSILAFLDSKAGVEISHPIGSSETITPTKITKTFSLTSVISNVKNKALSFVKHNEVNKGARKALTGDVAKRAMALLKTPPGSANSSPIKTRRSYDNGLHTAHNREAVISARKRVDSSPARNKDNKQNVRKPPVATQESNEDLSDSSTSDHKYYDSGSLTKSAKSIENLIRSPVRRPSTVNGDYSKDRKQVTERTGLSYKSHSVSNVSEVTENKFNIHNEIHGSSNEDVANKTIYLIAKKNMVNENAHSLKQAKGVLKNAPSTNSLNKKKVLFDLDAIQMKSVSASPSQSTEKSDANEKYELGLVNLDDDEWDISSIDNEPLKSSDHEIKLNLPPRTSPKIAELKQTIESQLAHRNTTQPLAPVGGIDVLKGPVTKVASIGGSNTTLGSSVFDDDAVPTTFIKPKLKRAEKDDSELDLSDFSIDGLTGGKRDSF